MGIAMFNCSCLGIALDSLCVGFVIMKCKSIELHF